MLDFITKQGSFDVLQSSASVITNWVQLGSFLVLPSGAGGITKYGLYYKVGQVLQSWAIVFCFFLYFL